MKRKVNLIFILMAILLCTIMAVLISACDNVDSGDNVHSHSFSTEWSYDDDYHWHKASCEHTSEISAKAKHNFIDGICSVCAYKTKEQSSATEKKTYDMSNVVFADLTVTYDGQKHDITASNLPDGVRATYEGNGKINAGKYTITAHFLGDATNYNSIPDMSATLTINKAVYNIDSIVLADLVVKYDGYSHSIEAIGLPIGISVSYENNNQTEAGDYIVTAKFTGDSLNYEPISDISATLTITREVHKVVFRQEGQPDIVKEVLDLAGVVESDRPSPVQKVGYTAVWEEKNLFRVTEDIFVNAVYIPNQYKITYFDRDSDSIFSGHFEEIYPTFHTYDSITHLIEPVREGYLFTGWFNNNKCNGTELTVLAEQDYTENINLYARWAATIKFNTDGGTEILPITQNPETPIFEPEEVPIKKSYIFVKWQLNGEDYVFDVMPNNNVVLVAVWEFFENGTEFYPYIISNKEQLMGVATLDNEDGSTFFELANDIDLEGMEWVPIKDFYGKIDGNNYRIYNFTNTAMLKTGYQSSGRTYIYETGIFCSTGLKSVIQNLGIDEFRISVTLSLKYYSGYSINLFAGGLVGRNSGLIENCYASGYVKISPNNYIDAQPNIYAGGLVGENSGEIKNSYSLGTVFGKGHSVAVGGITGNNSGSVSFCWTSGSIEVSSTYFSYSGGLVGKSSGTISNCYATGDVRASASNYDGNVDVYGGGLVGSNIDGNIYFSYATGDVEVSPSQNRYAYGGGLVGKHSDGLIMGCLATGSIKGYGNSNLGGIVGSLNGGTIAMSFGYVGQVISGGTYSSGCTFLQLNDKAFYLNELGWNAEDWDLSNLNFLNGCYPKLRIRN